jgi:hypothetical protein
MGNNFTFNFHMHGYGLIDSPDVDETVKNVLTFLRDNQFSERQLITLSDRYSKETILVLSSLSPTAEHGAENRTAIIEAMRSNGYTHTDILVKMYEDAGVKDVNPYRITLETALRLPYHNSGINDELLDRLINKNKSPGKVRRFIFEEQQAAIIHILAYLGNHIKPEERTEQIPAIFERLVENSHCNINRLYKSFEAEMSVLQSAAKKTENLEPAKKKARVESAATAAPYTSSSPLGMLALVAEEKAQQEVSTRLPAPRN